jgi:membrane protein YdbS with pleckstrin-like domain
MAKPDGREQRRRAIAQAPTNFLFVIGSSPRFLLSFRLSNPYRLAKASMNYVDSILEPNERVVFRTTLSWTLYARAVALAICALLLLILGASYPGLGVVGLFLAALLALAAFLSFVHAWFRRWTTEIAVTDRRVILKRGFIRRHTVEMNMQKVESVDVDQTRIGRIFDYGSVTIRGTGSSFESLRMVDAPLKLRTTITAA